MAVLLVEEEDEGQEEVGEEEAMTLPILRMTMDPLVDPHPKPLLRYL